MTRLIKFALAILLGTSAVMAQTTSGLPSPAATSSTLGSIQPDGSSVTVSPLGVLSAISSAPSPQYIAPQAISGCGVEYVAGLTYTVGACTYSINGIVYNSAATSSGGVVLATADPTNPRIDVIFVDTTQTVQVITGTPAASPQQPVVDPSTQLQLTFVLVPAASTTPANTTVTNIYLEGSEWTGAVGGTNSARVNLTSTSNPYTGTHDTEFGSGGTVTTTTYAQYTKPSSGTENLSNYNALVFYVRNKAAWPNARSITVQWFNGSTAKGTAIVVSNGAYGFNARTNTTSYQQVSIPVGVFGLAGIPVSTVRFTVTGTGAALTGFYLDQVTLQGGNGGVVLPSTLMNFKGAWSATATYSPNDLVTVANAGYVALSSSTGQVVTNATFWSSLVPAGTVGGCNFSVFGTENSNICGSLTAAGGGGHDNTAAGWLSMNALTGGVRNTAFGDQTLEANTTGSFNTALGQGALAATNGGSSNTAVGTAADPANVSGSNITAVGFQALGINTTGDNTAVGSNALGANTTGTNNTALGEALTGNSTGNENVAVGNNALISSNSSSNAAMGFESAWITTSGGDNAAFGWKSLRDNTTGVGNTAMGAAALLQAGTGSNNTAVGFEAGWNSVVLSTVANSTFLGAFASSTTNALTNMVVIGYNAQGTASNQVTLGNSSITSSIFNGTIHSAATAPAASVGTLTGTNSGGFIAGLSVATSVTITFANSGWTTWAACTATPSVTGITVFNSSQSTTAVTFSFAALTGTLYYTCTGN